MTHFDGNVIAIGVSVIAVVKVLALLLGRPN
jgi:hypothetical protein